MSTSDLCLVCQAPIQYDLTWQLLFSWRPLKPPVLCLECQAQLVDYQTDQEACQGCKRVIQADSNHPFMQVYPFQHQGQAYHYCHDCYQWTKLVPICLLNHDSLYQYNDFLANCLYRYKYLGDVRLARFASQGLETYYPAWSTYQWLVLPSSPQSIVDRGFHPTSELLNSARIPFVELFEYCGDGRHQAQKTRSERLKLKLPFALKASAQPLLTQEKQWLIFDDVYTTGTTMIQAKQLLYQQLSKYHQDFEICSLSLAREISVEKSIHQA